MTTYVVGDIQGCLQPLHCLLDQVSFDWGVDRLWAVGDLVNRGPDSLGVLQFLHQRRDRVSVVLGNHDLHLLAVASGAQQPRRSDTLDAILSAPDKELLLNWLRHQPLIHSELGYTMVHAGVPHLWSITQAHGYAREVEAVLQSDDQLQFFENMYGNTPALWNANLGGYERLKVITNYLTRMRFLKPDGSLDLVTKSTRPETSQSVKPWYELRGHDGTENKLIFGHWAALRGKTDREGVYATDTGCVWGQQLSMFCLESQQWHRCEC